MQGKGLIRFFLVFMLILSVYTFALFLPTNGVENRAERYAAERAEGMTDGADKDFFQRKYKQEFLDSMSNETVLNLGFRKFTYLELVQQQLALGLDLKGGMSVVMQVDLKELLIALAGGSEDPNFREALQKASKAQVNSQSDYISLFKKAFEEVAPGRQLAPLFANQLPDDIKSGDSNEKVKTILREKANETVDLTFKRLNQRIDKFGVAQPNVSLDESTDRILVELPGVDNPERARELLQATAKLEFFDIYLPDDIFNRLQVADTKLKEQADANKKAAEKNQANQTTTDVDTSATTETDSSGTTDVASDSDSPAIELPTTPDSATTDSVSPLSTLGPIFSKLQFNPYTGQPEAPGFIGQALIKDTAALNKTLRSPQVNLPKDLRFFWANKANTDEDGKATDVISLYAVKKPSTGAPLEGDVITDARADLDPNTNSYNVSLTMNGRGRQAWSQMTTKAAPTKRQIAIVLDNEVVSAPAVQNPINDGRTQITGRFSPQEAQDLANILQVGKLPAKTKIIEEAIVGPTLGAKNIRSSLTALAAGMIILLIFMVVYYGSGGIVSIIALLLNLLFVVTALASIGTVLTLPGIAGIILTIGMAVDANVIIYERIREELREGKSLLAAIKDGFMASYSAIIDANVTTILTAFVLFYFGLGPIKGFATTLIIGVISSLFTAVLVGRLLIDWWTGRGKDIAFASKFSENAFSKMNFDFVAARRTSYMVSGGIIFVGLISFFVFGFEQGVDFQGGYSYVVQFEKPVSVDDIRQNMTVQFNNEAPVVKSFGGDNSYQITTSHMIRSTDENADKKVLRKVYQGVVQTLGGVDTTEFTLAKFARTSDAGGADTYLKSSNKVGPTIADDITQSAFYSAIFALLLIFLYIFVRFRKWQYSLGAVAALFHDVLIVLTLFSLGKLFLPFSVEIDQAFIAAILTVIGYSINDTVVVFDRIREFINAYTRKDKKEVFNLAVNNTISRTIITSLTTLFVILMLFIFSSGSIKGFAFALLVGILVGTYSSVFIATPVVYDFTDEMQPKEVGKGKDKGKRTSKYASERDAKA